MVKVKYKIAKVTYYDDDGVQRRKFVPMRKASVLGFGKWEECEGWSEKQKTIAEDRFLNRTNDSDLTHIKRFIDAQPDNIDTKNKFYYD